MMIKDKMADTMETDNAQSLFFAFSTLNIFEEIK